MTSKLFASLALAGTAVLGLSVNASADLQKPASLLVFPCYDNGRGVESLITVTNTNCDEEEGDVSVEFIYINGQNCLETNRTRNLTPCDTITVLASSDNPNSKAGYLYVFAKRAGAAVSFNHLIGQSFTFSAYNNVSTDDLDFELTPIGFLAVADEGLRTDLVANGGDGDGRRDLDGVEYEQAPDELAFARFIGNGDGVESHLCLINLVGARFNAVIDFLIYNDNEEVFSAQYTIDCWDRVELCDINGVFDHDFLENNTNQDDNEVYTGGSNVEVNEVGWFSLNGLIANSTADVVSDPAILAALVENVDGDGGGQLPWALGDGQNGELLNLSIFSDL
jgi:hypothetical protein